MDIIFWKLHNLFKELFKHLKDGEINKIDQTFGEWEAQELEEDLVGSIQSNNRTVYHNNQDLGSVHLLAVELDLEV